MLIIDLVMMVLYLLMMILIGIWSTKKIKTDRDYLVAGKRLGYGLYVPAMGAVVLGGASTLGGASLGYKYGISGMWLVFMIGLGLIGLGVFFSNRLGRLEIFSVSELLGKRFGPTSRYFSAIVMMVYDIMVVVTSIIALGVILTTLFGWNATFSMLVGGSIVLFYTTVGGMWAVTQTDVVQFWIKTVGLIFVLLPIALVKTGGYSGLHQHLDASFFNLTSIGPSTIFSYFLLFFFGIMIGQDIWQRALTAKNVTVLRNGTIAAGIYSLVYAITGALIGMSARVLLPDLSDAQQALPQLALELLPHGLIGLLFAAMAAAVMGTASGTLIAASTIVINDLVIPLSGKNWNEQSVIRSTRLATLVGGLLAIGIGIWVKEIVVALDVAYAFLSGSIFLPVIAALFWKRVSPRIILTSMLISSVVVVIDLAVEGISSLNAIIYGLIASALTIGIGVIAERK